MIINPIHASFGDTYQGRDPLRRTMKNVGIDFEKILKGRSKDEVSRLILELVVKKLQYKDKLWQEWFDLCAKVEPENVPESFRDILEESYINIQK